MRRVRSVAVRAVSVMVLAGSLANVAGCASQIDGLAPVSGDIPAGIRSAAIDVLLEQRLTILQAPECTATPQGWSCLGSLTDGALIVVTAPGKAPDRMTVKVGDALVYEGSIQEVLDDAAQVGG